MNIEEYSKIAPQYYSDCISELLKKYLLNHNFTTFLDCGCGDGNLLSALIKNKYLIDKKVFAIDLSKNRIDLVRKIDVGITAMVDNAEEMKTIENNSIDFFVSTMVIEHIDDNKMMNNIHRVVKKDGIIYISTVFKKWYGWYFYRNNGKWVLDPTHLREYKKDCELLDLFDRNKFKLLENKKTLERFPIIDFFVKRLGIRNRKLYNNLLFRILRKIRIPIPGYYSWELVFKKI
ncbi:MAG: class I SAM-dependent methyltransferase [Candidatus Magasanikbacteria bacterium]|nr:class I SAM-dependent methyltransferase [Candidatus Magasanikbacteria bacterium]